MSGIFFDFGILGFIGLVFLFNFPRGLAPIEVVEKLQIWAPLQYFLFKFFGVITIVGFLIDRLQPSLPSEKP